jgi:hypothetical protein
MAMAEDTFTREELADGRIVCFRFVTTGSEAAEVWFREVIDLFSSWDKSKPLLLLIDLSQPDNMLSPEAIKSGREASVRYPNVPGKTALLIDAGSPAHNVEAMVDHVLAGARPREIFTDQTEAVAWLLQN